MSEKDQRLEDFIRKGLSQPEFAFREEDWALMEAKLTNLPAAPSVWKRLRWWALGSVLFLTSFFFGWFLKGSLDANSPSAQTEISNPSQNQHLKEKAQSPEKERENLKENGQAQFQTPSNAGAQEIESKSPTTNTPIALQSTVFDTPPFQPDGDHQLEPYTLIETQTASSGIYLLDSKPWSLFAFKETYPGEIKSVKRETIITPDSISESKKSKGRHYHAAIGLSVSPDFTGTSIKKGFESMGETYGLGLEFYATERLRIKLAAYQTRKVYSASGEKYNIPGSSGYYNPQQLENVDAVCEILEVPLFIQYSLWNQGRNRLWLSNGLSSYWMRREEYHYQYKNPGSYPKSALIEKENRHLFSVVSIGLALERSINKHLSLELEPYLKVPLGGVGYGKVTLYSSGAYFSVKYHISR